MKKKMPLAVRFCNLLARRLHEYGTAAHRLESAVISVATQLGWDCQVFSTPTSIFLTYRKLGESEDLITVPTQLLRLRPGDIDIGRLASVDQIADEVASGEIDLKQGADRLLAVPESGPNRPLASHLLSWGAVGLTVAALLGSSWTDIGIAALLGMITGLFAMRLGTYWQEVGSFEPITAFVITVLAYVLSDFLGGSQVPNTVIAAMIILMPGLNLTVAITELSTGHLASGTARFAGAVVVLVKLSLGVVMATQMMHALGFASGLELDPSTLPPTWFAWLALLITGLAFGVLFNAQLQDWPAVVVAAISAFGTNFFAAQYVGSELAVFLAALVVAGVSNAYGRIYNRPSSIMRLPGIILLVPGSLGYRSLTLLFSRNMTDGLDAAVSVAVVLASLVGGLLLGNTLIPPRRSL
jgi:uncharacterized membrane protein YjjP (DUF1212 family)